jgi:hypothetical protein
VAGEYAVLKLGRIGAKKFGSGGKFYRLPAREANGESHANLHRLGKGFAYRKPFAPMGTV